MTEFISPINREGAYLKVFETLGLEIVPEEEKDWSIEGLEKLVVDSVKMVGQKCLEENSGVIHTTLSGGLDSTLALAILRENFPEAKVATYTMGGQENHPDIKYSRQASARYRTEHHEFLLDHEEKDQLQAYIADYQGANPGADLKKAAQSGDIDVFILYQKIFEVSGGVSVIVHDGIDEQLGGYWQHAREVSESEKTKIFRQFWKALKTEHLEPLIKSASSSKIRLRFPYLEDSLVRYISRIPLSDRVREGVCKRPLREIAGRHEVPPEIINREKMGQVDMGTILDSRYR